MPAKKPDWKIHNPTTRKVLNRGFRPASLRTNYGTRWGWIVEEKGAVTRFAQITADGQKLVRIKGPDRKYLRYLD